MICFCRWNYEECFTNFVYFLHFMMIAYDCYRRGKDSGQLSNKMLPFAFKRHPLSLRLY